jgi:hypothetical protein
MRSINESTLDLGAAMSVTGDEPDGERQAGRSPWLRLVGVFPCEPDDTDPDLPDGEVLAQLGDCEALLTQVAARQSRLLLELRRRRLVLQAVEHPHEGGVCSCDAPPDETDLDELPFSSRWSALSTDPVLRGAGTGGQGHVPRHRFGRHAQRFMWNVRLITSFCCSRVSRTKFTA